MYTGQKTLDPMRQQCAALKSRLDLATGHNRTIVRPRGSAILVLIEKSDIPRLKGRVPDQMGIFPVDVELKVPGKGHNKRNR